MEHVNIVTPDGVIELPTDLQLYSDKTLKHVEQVHNYRRIEKGTFKTVLVFMEKLGCTLSIKKEGSSLKPTLKLSNRFVDRGKEICLGAYSDDYPIERILTDTDVYFNIMKHIGHAKVTFIEELNMFDKLEKV